MQGPVQGHQTAHAGAADGGAGAHGIGAVIRVDDGFQFLDDPVKGVIPGGGDALAEGVLQSGPGEVLAQPFALAVAALDTHNDDVLGPAAEEGSESPGFAVGGIRVGEEVVAVQEVHDGIARLGAFVVIGQPDV